MPALGKDESVKAKANRTERDQAKKLGGRVHPASGALSGFKGDFSVGDFLFDSKETAGTQLMLHVKEITKICREANEAGKCPALSLKIAKMPSTVPNEWVAVPLQQFAEMLERLEDVSE